MDLSESVSALNKWLWHDDVWRVALQSLGSEYDNFHLEKGLRRLSDSANLHEAMMSTSCEYLALIGRQIVEEKGKLCTGRSVSKEEYVNYYVNYIDPPLALCQSVWQKKRVLIFLDIEYFTSRDCSNILLNQEEVLAAVEPVYSLIREKLLSLGIDHIAILTGRGYNFISSVPFHSPLVSELVRIGGTIEPTLAAKQKYPAFKRHRAVTEREELSFKGALRLMLFLAGLIIHDARRLSYRLPVEMSDIGDEGIALDLTMLTRSVDNSNCSIPDSPYIKLHFQKILDPEVFYQTPIPVRLIRARGWAENFPDMRTMVKVRNNYYEALKHFSNQDGHIPDGSSGIRNLIRLYRESPMAYFHHVMDSEEHEPYEIWNKTYRNYNAICIQFPHLAHIIYNPNPSLLQPDKLNRLINDFMDAGWHPKHIGGFIRSIYEDNHLADWGNRFEKYDAAKWANGWVEILGAQRYFGPT